MRDTIWEDYEKAYGNALMVRKSRVHQYDVAINSPDTTSKPRCSPEFKSTEESSAVICSASCRSR